jgi:hypothetical protein
VIFKNQARGTDDKRKKEFVNVSFVPALICFDDGLLIIFLGPSAVGLSQAVHEVSSSFSLRNLVANVWHSKYVR